MEFFDEDARPRFLLQATRISSKPNPNAETLKPSKTHLFICTPISFFLLFLSFFSFSYSQTFQLFLIWISLSLLIGPFAPISFTGGDISVGKGETLQPLDPIPTAVDEPKTRIPNRRLKSRKPEEPLLSSPLPTSESKKPEHKAEVLNASTGGSIVSKKVEEEWTEEDFDLLKKQMTKHPVGAPLRWEVIAEAFKGRHGLESVIKTAKSMADKRPGSGSGDSFVQFLKQRKPLSKKIEGVNGELTPDVVLTENGDGKEENGSSSWTAGEDIALLNALKAFPKDVSMRWEKIAAAVPGKSKACCMKRVGELKRDFRSSKASET